MHKSLVFGALMILAIFFFLKYPYEFVFKIDIEAFTIVGFGTVIFGSLVSQIFNQKIKEAVNQGNQNSQDPLWIKQHKLVSWACLEGAALINAVFFYATDNSLFLILALTAILLLISLAPKKAF